MEHIPEPLYLPSFEEIKEKKEQYARSFGIQHQNTDPYQAKVLIEDYGNQGYVVQNPPAYPLTEQEMDDVYHLPFMRTYHPMYEKKVAFRRLRRSDSVLPVIADVLVAVIFVL